MSFKPPKDNIPANW